MDAKIESWNENSITALYTVSSSRSENIFAIFFIDTFVSSKAILILFVKI